jgi:hypothetical protein
MLAERFGAGRLPPPRPPHPVQPADDLCTWVNPDTGARCRLHFHHPLDGPYDHDPEPS